MPYYSSEGCKDEQVGHVVVALGIDTTLKISMQEVCDDLYYCARSGLSLRIGAAVADECMQAHATSNWRRLMLIAFSCLWIEFAYATTGSAYEPSWTS